MSRRATPLNINRSHKAQLQTWISSPNLSENRKRKARTLLLLEDGQSPSQIANLEKVSIRSISNWKKSFLEMGPEGLLEKSRPGRPLKRDLGPLVISEEDRSELERLSRSGKTHQKLSNRCKVILLLEQGTRDREICKITDLSTWTIRRIRERYKEQGLDSLVDRPRSGRKRSITDAQIQEVLSRTLQTTPDNATHWSTRTMGKVSGLSKTTIHSIWKAFHLQPHRTETFKLSTDPFFVDKVRDIVGLYLSPPSKAAVFCVDEKSQIQALDRTQPIFPMGFGSVEKRTHDYERHGVTSLFAAYNTATGKVLGKCYRRHRSKEFKKFLVQIDENVPKEMDIHLVLDNYATHKTPMIQRWLLNHPRFKLHFTPTSSSWINMVERWFGHLTEKRIRRGTFKSVKALEKAIYDYLQDYNKDSDPFVWTKSADEILNKVKRFCSNI